MAKLFEVLNGLCGDLSSFLWSYPMLFLLLFAGIFFTIGTKFFQITHFSLWIKTAPGTVLRVKKEKSKGTLTGLQALCTSLASTIGTGNISGTAVAIATGGAGAVFWMWVSAFFGMMTSYGENVLGIYYRSKEKDPAQSPGPMCYISHAFGCGKKSLRFGKAMAIVFCISCVFVSLGMGNMAQGASIALALGSDFGISRDISGALVGVAVAVVIIGGAASVGKVCEKIVPPMAFLYIALTLWVFVSNYDRIGYVFKSIVCTAFCPDALLGASSGILIKHTISTGFKRGLFSNEAGLGSSVLAHSSSSQKEPAVQGMVGIFVVFFDTFIICTLTAVTLLSSTCVAYTPDEALKGLGGEKRLVSVCDTPTDHSGEISIIGHKYSSTLVPAEDKNPHAQTYTVSPLTGSSFDISLTKEKDPASCTNVMALSGVYVDANGKEIKAPHGSINAVKLEKIEGVSLVTLAFSQRFGSLSGKIVALCVFFFAFSSIIGWSFYGMKAWQYMLGNSRLGMYKAIYVVCTFLGFFIDGELIWNFSDVANAFMAFVNLVAILLLSPKVFEITREYLVRTKR